MASRSWNRVELIGNLTRDPELRYTPTGAAVCTFGVATNRTYVSDGEKKEEVDFHRLVSWNKLAELCNQLLKKGNRVFISGRLQNRSWEGQDGQTRNVTEIVVEDMIILTPKTNGETYIPDDINIRTSTTVATQTQPKVDTVTLEENIITNKEPEEIEDKPKVKKTDSSDSEKNEETEKSRSASKVTPKEEVDESDLPF